MVNPLLIIFLWNPAFKLFIVSFLLVTYSTTAFLSSSVSLNICILVKVGRAKVEVVDGATSFAFGRGNDVVKETLATVLEKAVLDKGLSTRCC